MAPLSCSSLAGVASTMTFRFPQKLYLDATRVQMQFHVTDCDRNGPCGGSLQCSPDPLTGFEGAAS